MSFSESTASFTFDSDTSPSYQSSQEPSSDLSRPVSESTTMYSSLSESGSAFPFVHSLDSLDDVAFETETAPTQPANASGWPTLSVDLTMAPSFDSESRSALSSPCESFIQQSTVQFDFDDDPSSTSSLSAVSAGSPNRSFDFLGEMKNFTTKRSSSPCGLPDQRRRRRRRTKHRSSRGVKVRPLSEPRNASESSDDNLESNSFLSNVPDFDELLETREQEARLDEAMIASEEERFCQEPTPLDFDGFRSDMITDFLRKHAKRKERRGVVEIMGFWEEEVDPYERRSDVVDLFQRKRNEVDRLFDRAWSVDSILSKVYGSIPIISGVVIVANRTEPIGAQLSPFLPRLGFSFAYLSSQTQAKAVPLLSSFCLPTPSPDLTTFHRTSLFDSHCLKEFEGGEEELLRSHTPEREYEEGSTGVYGITQLDLTYVENLTTPMVEVRHWRDEDEDVFESLMMEDEHHYLYQNVHLVEQNTIVELMVREKFDYGFEDSLTNSLVIQVNSPSRVLSSLRIGNELAFLSDILFVVKGTRVVFHFAALQCIMSHVTAFDANPVNANVCLWKDELEDAERSALLELVFEDGIDRDWVIAFRPVVVSFHQGLYSCVILDFTRGLPIWVETWFYRDEPMMQQMLFGLTKTKQIESERRRRMRQNMTSFCGGRCLGFFMDESPPLSSTQNDQMMLLVCGYPFDLNRGSFNYYHIITMLRVMSDHGSDLDQLTFSNVLRNIAQSEYMGLRVEDADLERRTEDCHQFVEFLLRLLSEEESLLSVVPVHVFQEHILPYLTELDAYAAFHRALVERCEFLNQIRRSTDRSSLENSIHLLLFPTSQDRRKRMRHAEAEVEQIDQAHHALFHAVYSKLQDCDRFIQDEESVSRLCRDWKLYGNDGILDALMGLVSFTHSIPETASWRQTIDDAVFVDLLHYIKNLLLLRILLFVAGDKEASKTSWIRYSGLKRHLVECLRRFVVEGLSLKGESGKGTDDDEETQATTIINAVKSVVNKKDFEYFCRQLGVECPKYSHLVVDRSQERPETQ